MTQIKTKGGGRLFRNPLLEMLTKTHPAVIISMYLPLCAFLLWYFHAYIEPSISVLIITFLLGVLTWTFFEYILHRYVFHITGESQLIKKFAYFVHGVHHEYPRDTNRLVMPPLPSLVLAFTFFAFFWLVLGIFNIEIYVSAYFSGFMIGYLTYAMIHYATHAFRPPHNFFKFLWTYHALHHYKYPEKAFGVSSPLWDYVFGTVPPKQPAEKKAVVTKN